MTRLEKSERLCKVYDAWKAGYITTQQCEEKTQRIEREYYIATHGEFNPDTL